MLPFRGSGKRAPVLREGRVLLRAPALKDWRAWADLRLESRTFLVPWEPTWPYDALTRAAFRRRVRQYAQERREGSGHALLIFHAEEEMLLGGISLSNLRRGVAQSASLGYWIGARHARQGYMSEALGVVLEHAFGSLGLHRVEAACLPQNLASRRLLEKMGFREEGHAREFLRINGSWQDHVLYALLEDDSREQRAAPPVMVRSVAR